jgi:hypothetical protein
MVTDQRPAGAYASVLTPTPYKPLRLPECELSHMRNETCASVACTQSPASTRLRIPVRVAGPMPFTSSSFSTAVNGPCSLRWSTMAWAQPLPHRRARHSAMTAMALISMR